MATLRLKDHPGVANEHALRAKALENRVEDVVGMLKLREIYRPLSNSADRGDEAANVITDIVVKMT